MNEHPVLRGATGKINLACTVRYAGTARRGGAAKRDTLLT